MSATDPEAHPRPMLRRGSWTLLDGSWAFAHDDGDVGLAERWSDPAAEKAFDQVIAVPFPPESPASGLAARGFHPVVWYRRTVDHATLVGSTTGAQGRRVLLHFGAVDHRAHVWVDGRLVAEHVGGQSPFAADVTDALDPDADEHVVVVRAEDDPTALDQPRGKQDWREQPHGIWYDRTTGIWQSVWAETVPAEHFVDAAWTPDVSAGVVHAAVTLSGPPRRPLLVSVRLLLGEELLAEVSCRAQTRVVDVVVAVPALRNGQERARLLWSPESPTLVDVEVVLREAAPSDGDGAGAVVDSVESYLGLRSVSVGGGSFRLNDQPYETRSVLNQGFRPETHLATRGSDELRREVALTKAMGFNAVRVHQKAEDPRFLYWADRLGLLVWGETASPYEFSTDSVTLLTREWLDLVRRDRSHPSVVAWVPINESWGVQDIAMVPAQQQFAQALASLTRALDPSRPVVSNEGWEHVDSDILGLHDYTVDPEHLRARYADADSAVLAGHGPQGRRPVLSEHQRQLYLAGDAPLMITEFGGISLSQDAETWGYGHVDSPEEYAEVLRGLFDALRASPDVVGFCYTQFMDTGQETNGLLFADGTPKLPVETIRAIVTGREGGAEEAPTSTFGWTE